MLGKCLGTMEEKKIAQNINIMKTPKDDNTSMQRVWGTLGDTL
jgi:hypothetical protein